MGGSSTRGYEREVKAAVLAAVRLLGSPPRWVFSLAWLVLALCVMRMALADDEVSIRDRYPGRMVALGDH